MGYLCNNNHRDKLYTPLTLSNSLSNSQYGLSLSTTNRFGPKLVSVRSYFRCEDLWYVVIFLHNIYKIFTEYLNNRIFIYSNEILLSNLTYDISIYMKRHTTYDFKIPNQ